MSELNILHFSNEILEHILLDTTAAHVLEDEEAPPQYHCVCRRWLYIMSAPAFKRLLNRRLIVLDPFRKFEPQPEPVVVKDAGCTPIAAMNGELFVYSESETAFTVYGQSTSASEQFVEKRRFEVPLQSFCVRHAKCCSLNNSLYICFVDMTLQYHIVRVSSTSGKLLSTSMPIHVFPDPSDWFVSRQGDVIKTTATHPSLPHTIDYIIYDYDDKGRLHRLLDIHQFYGCVTNYIVAAKFSPNDYMVWDLYAGLRQYSMKPDIPNPVYCWSCGMSQYLEPPFVNLQILDIDAEGRYLLTLETSMRGACRVKVVRPQRTNGSKNLSERVLATFHSTGYFAYDEQQHRLFFVDNGKLQFYNLA